MGFSIAELFKKKPRWVTTNDVVAGTRDAKNQDASVHPDGTVVHNIDGAENRHAGDIWGNLKYLAMLIGQSHADDGSHNLGPDDFDPTNPIPESVLNLYLTKVINPNTGENFKTTEELTEFVISLREIINTLPNNSASMASDRLRSDYINSLLLPLHWTDFSYPHGRNEGFEVTNGEAALLFGGRMVYLNGSMSVDDVCKVDLGLIPGIYNTPVKLSEQMVVVLEMWEHDVDKAGYIFPYGNTQYRNSDAEADDYIPFKHSSHKVNKADPAFITVSSQASSNIYYDANGKIKQLVYVMYGIPIDYANFKDGLTDPSCRSIVNGRPFTSKANEYGVWETLGGVIATSATRICILNRRNAGTYHFSMNPAGCAMVRRGVDPDSIRSRAECFRVGNIAYFDVNGLECPNYDNAVHDSETDIMVYNGTQYFRSGLSMTQKSGHIQGYYCDVVLTDDVLSCKRELMDGHKAIFKYEHQTIANCLNLQLLPVFYGNASAPNQAQYYSQKPIQIIGFGTSEAHVFGTANLGGIFIDQTNNGYSAIVDEARYCWNDQRTDQRVAFSMLEGDDTSESKPSIVTYTPGNQYISINTTALRQEPVISRENPPQIFWENGDQAILSQDWIGLGSSSANCRLTVADIAAHAGQHIYGEFSITYQIGSGVPYTMGEIIKVEDLDGNEFTFADINDEGYYDGFSYNGQAAQGSSSTEIILSGTTPTSNIVGHYLHHPSSGTSSRVISFNKTTKVATVAPALGATPDASSSITISPIPVAGLCVLFNRNSRAVLGGLARDRYTANSYGVVCVDRIIKACSAGVNKGTIVTGLTPGQAIDVIYWSEHPFNTGFRVYFINRYQAAMFEPLDQNDEFEIEHVGHTIATNIGSCNNSGGSYLNFLPEICMPMVDGVTYIGTTQAGSSEEKLSFNLIETSQFDWELVPHEGLTIKGATLETDMIVAGKAAMIESDSTIAEKGDGMYSIFLLVRSKLNGRHLILVSMGMYEEFGITKPENVFMLEISRIAAVR